MKKIVLLFVLVFSLNAQAVQWGAFVGFNYTEFESDVSWDHDFGFELGAAFHHMLTNNLHLRTGLGYVQKNSSFKIVGSTAEFELSYIEIPATIIFKAFSDIALIGGANINLKVGDDCSGGSCTGIDIEDYVINAVFGMNFRTPGGEYVETLLEFTGLSDIATNISMGSSLSVRYVYMF